MESTKTIISKSPKTGMQEVVYKTHVCTVTSYRNIKGQGRVKHSRKLYSSVTKHEIA